MGKRQRQIYDFIKEFLRKHNYPPTIREIASAVGLNSSSTVHSHLNAMREKGYIDFIASRPRTIHIIKREYGV